MAVLAKKAAPEWERFVAVEASIAQPADFQSTVGSLMAGRRQRHLERTAILVIGTVRQSFEDGAIVSRTLGDNVFVSGLAGFASEEMVRVLVHEDGFFKITNQEGAPATLRKFRFFRSAPSGAGETFRFAAPGLLAKGMELNRPPASSFSRLSSLRLP